MWYIAVAKTLPIGWLYITDPTYWGEPETAIDVFSGSYGGFESTPWKIGGALDTFRIHSSKRGKTPASKPSTFNLLGLQFLEILTKICLSAVLTLALEIINTVCCCFCTEKKPYILHTSKLFFYMFGCIEDVCWHGPRVNHHPTKSPHLLLTLYSPTGQASILVLQHPTKSTWMSQEVRIKD